MSSTLVSRRQVLRGLLLGPILVSVGLQAACAPAPTAAPAAVPQGQATTAPAAATTAPAAATAAPAAAASTAAPATAAQQTTAATTTGPTLPPVQGSPVSGGTLVWLISADVQTFDPALASDGISWTLMLGTLSNGLYRYDEKSQMVPDLATTLPQVADGGTRFTVSLKKGVKFHNGREIQAADHKYAWERTANPKTKSWGSTFNLGLQGADDFVAGKTADIVGIKIVDPYTLEFRLNKPQLSFPNVLAMSTNHPVPKEEVDRLGDQFGQQPVLNGPFKLKEWTKGQKLSLVKNPDYHEPGKPYLDGVEVQIVPPDVALLRVEKGEADFPYNNVPETEIARVLGDAKLKARTGRYVANNYHYLFMNVQMEPFTDKRVRQAVAHAIDKESLGKLLAGTAISARGIYPPAVPGYDTNYKGLPYDVDRAKALLKEAGVGDVSTEIWARTGRFAWTENVMQGIQEDLGKVGIKAEIRMVAGPAFSAEVGKPKTVPMGLVFWGMDYPDPQDFIQNLFVCAAAPPAGSNNSYYCNADTDGLFQKAEATTEPAQRIQLYQQLEKAVVEDAPRVSLFHIAAYTLYSDKLQVPAAGVPANFNMRASEVWKLK
ncbi:MAG TPA: ABC transporter substrate-binding protein [Chloroflexota bacterium]